MCLCIAMRNSQKLILTFYLIPFALFTHHFPAILLFSVVSDGFLIAIIFFMIAWSIYDKAL